VPVLRYADKQTCCITRVVTLPDDYGRWCLQRHTSHVRVQLFFLQLSFFVFLFFLQRSGLAAFSPSLVSFLILSSCFSFHPLKARKNKDKVVWKQ
jgi:hypothetical protein